MYSILHALRAIVCQCTRTGEHGSPLHYYLGNCISFIQFIFIINFLPLLSGRPMNAPTGLCERLQYYARAWYVFWHLQTVFTNWVRRLAVRAPDVRPYELFCVCTQNKWRSLTAATDDTQPSYKQKRSGNNVLHFANLLPDHNFPFSIFNFTFIKPFARYFKQRFAPFIRHRRRSQGYPYCCNSTSAIALPNRLPE